jgi:hypothetical protein
MFQFIGKKRLPFEKSVKMKAVLEGYARRESARISLMKPKSPLSTLRPLGNFSGEIVRW